MPEPKLQFETIDEAAMQRIVTLVVQKIRAGFSNDIADSQTSLDTLVLDSPLITMESLPKDWSEFKTVQVRANAIVTPAVKDELNDKKLRLLRSNVSESNNVATQNSKPNTTENNWLIGQLSSSPAAQAATTAFTRNYPNAVISAAGNLDAFESDLKNGGAEQCSIVLTDDPHSALWKLNQLPGIRAAWVQRPEQVDFACRSFDANVLVLDCNTNSMFELKRIASLFAQTKRNH